MPLTQAQVDQFKTNGFVAVPNFFGPSEVRAMQLETERFKRDGLLRNVRTEGDGKTASTAARNLQICPMFHRSSLFRALPFEPKVVEAVTQLIGGPMILHLDQMFLKPAGDGDGTNWHQDNAYFRIADPLKGTAMWIAVHDATIANGTMNLIPNSFKETLPHERDPMSDHHIRCWPDENKQVPVELAAGGVIFFCYGTPHCTRANRTERDRAGAAFHFLHAEYAQLELINDARQDRPYLTGPKATGGMREYGQTIAGTWPIELSKALSLEAELALAR
ncbi:MAG: phytanoyl-CoA dioxygenase family protein [Planctomycetota bacterium]|nr:phytanoyl-CoA dioxygenase family protein [Planctomycetota bacterium]